MELYLHNKTVLITGSTSGIGKAIAKEFLMEHAKVIINGRNEQRVREVVEELAVYGEVYGIAADLSKREEVQSLVEKVKGLGTLDVLVNNAAIYKGKGFFELTEEDWLQVFTTNVLSMVRLAQAFLPAMLEANTGRIINMASEAAFKPYTKLIPYSMSKAAVVNISKALAEHTAGYNITVNSILPGPTLTEETQELIERIALEKGKSFNEVETELITKHSPTSSIQRFIRVEEIAGSVVYLASDRAAAITGSALRIEGGLLQNI